MKNYWGDDVGNKLSSLKVHKKFLSRLYKKDAKSGKDCDSSENSREFIENFPYIIIIITTIVQETLFGATL